MAIVFFTGFPGFLGSELIPRVLGRSSEDRAVCLIQSKFFNESRSRIAHIESTNPRLRGRIDLTIGDITKTDLGLENISKLKNETSEIFHLAAIYDLSVRRDVAMRVNVQGTRNVLNFADGIRELRRLHYVSTCFVSGRHNGVFFEGDLDKGQSFNNYYEETKHLAEVEVQTRMHAGLPTTIYRPAIVVGDSRTGVTQKYDGPYSVIRWALRQPFIAILPVVGKSSVTRVNLVPSDFVVDAITYLSGLNTSAGKVYQLADPNPLTVSELITLIGRATRRVVVRIPLPIAVAKFAINNVPGIYRLMKIPSASVDYFAHPTTYDCANTLMDLEGSGVEVPRLPAYINQLVQFVQRNPEIGSASMT